MEAWQHPRAVGRPPPLKNCQPAGRGAHPNPHKLKPQEGVPGPSTPHQGQDTEQSLPLPGFSRRAGQKQQDIPEGSLGTGGLLKRPSEKPSPVGRSTPTGHTPINQKHRGSPHG